MDHYCLKSGGVGILWCETFFQLRIVIILGLELVKDCLERTLGKIYSPPPGYVTWPCVVESLPDLSKGEKGVLLERWLLDFSPARRPDAPGL
jgi:hypothetical protein